MNIKIRSALCVTIFMAFGATPSFAQNLNVNVPIGQSGSITQKGPISAEQKIKEIPGGVDVVKEKEFKNGYALSLKDVLATTPGVLAGQRYNEEIRLSVRGSGLSRGFHLRGLNLLQDGIPFNLADNSGDFQEIDPLALQYVELYRGGQALRYGSSSLGGAINMVTPSAHTIPYNGLLRSELGSNKTLRLHAQVAKTFKDYDVFAATTGSYSEGYRPQSEQNNRRFSGNIGATINPNYETRFYIAHNDIEQEVPGTISKFNALNNPKVVPVVNITGDYARDIKSIRISNKSVYAFDNGWSLELGGFINDKSLYHPIFQVIDQNSIDLGFFSKLEGDYTIGNYNNNFTVGVNLRNGDNDAKRFVNVSGNRGNLTSDTNQIANEFNIYGENRFEFAPKFTLVTGAQASLAKRDYEDLRNSINNADKDYNSFNPKLGILYKLNPKTEFYSSITKSTEAPTFSELVQGAVVGFVPVDMQKAWTAEVGTRGAHNAFSWDVTFYNAWVRDELLNYTVTSNVPASTFNADKTIHRGFELGAGWQASDTISFQTIYNLNDFYFDGDAQYGDNELAGAPRHDIRVMAKYSNNGFYVEPNVQFTPRAAFVDYANTLKSDEPTLFGVKAGWDMNDKISFFVDGRNLTNEENISSFSTITDARAVGTNVFYPGEQRSFYIGATIKF